MTAFLRFIATLGTILLYVKSFVVISKEIDFDDLDDLDDFDANSYKISHSENNAEDKGQKENANSSDELN